MHIYYDCVYILNYIFYHLKKIWCGKIIMNGVLFFFRDSFNLWRSLLIIVFYIKSRYQLVFYVSRDQTTYILSNESGLHLLS